jgi:hypothetical protein
MGDHLLAYRAQHQSGEAPTSPGPHYNQTGCLSSIEQNLGGIAGGHTSIHLDVPIGSQPLGYKGLVKGDAKFVEAFGCWGTDTEGGNRPQGRRMPDTDHFKNRRPKPSLCGGGTQGLQRTL